MKVAKLITEGRLELVDVPAPEMTAADQVLIRMRAVGVCGSEVHAYQGTHPYRKAPVFQEMWWLWENRFLAANLVTAFMSTHNGHAVNVIIA
jgi:hypothetical protein